MECLVTNHAFDLTGDCVWTCDVAVAKCTVLMAYMNDVVEDDAFAISIQYKYICILFMPHCKHTVCTGWVCCRSLLWVGCNEIRMVLTQFELQRPSAFFNAGKQLPKYWNRGLGLIISDILSKVTGLTLWNLRSAQKNYMIVLRFFHLKVNWNEFTEMMSASFCFSLPLRGKEKYSVLEAGNHDHLGGIAINATESPAISYSYKPGNVYPTSLGNPFWEMHCTYFHSEVKRWTWRNDFSFVLFYGRYVNRGGFFEDWRIGGGC